MQRIDEYLRGIREIDEQHESFAECMLNIERAVARHDRPSADVVLVRLADLAQTHFTLEESLMRNHDYPRLEEHADDHKTFFVRLRTLQERFITTDVFLDRIKRLREWRDTHVQQHDRSFALHFLKCTALGKS